MEPIINIEHVYINLEVSDKNELFRVLLDQLDSVEINNKEVVYQAIQARENEVPTGFMEGIAIPHAKTDGMNKTVVLVGRLQQAIEWETMDGDDVDLVFLILTPSSQVDNSHLKVLSKLAERLMEEEIIHNLKVAETPKQIVQILEGEFL